MSYEESATTLRTAVIEKDRVILYLEVYSLDTEGKPSSHVLSHSEPVVTREDKTMVQHLDAIDAALAALQAYVLGARPDADPTVKLRPVARVVEPVEPIQEVKR